MNAKERFGNGINGLIRFQNIRREIKPYDLSVTQLKEHKQSWLELTTADEELA